MPKIENIDRKYFEEYVQTLHNYNQAIAERLREQRRERQRPAHCQRTRENITSEEAQS